MVALDVFLLLPWDILFPNQVVHSRRQMSWSAKAECVRVESGTGTVLISSSKKSGCILGSCRTLVFYPFLIF